MNEQSPAPDRPQRAARDRRRVGGPALAAALVLGLTLALAVVMLGGRSREGGTARSVEEVRIMRDSRLVFRVRAERIAHLDQAALQRSLRGLDRPRTERRGRARVELRLDRSRLAVAVRAVAARGGGIVTLPEVAVASSTTLPVVKQALRNNCETAALSMLLAARGVDASQLELQRQLPQSGPVDPRRTRSGELLWGDPGRGYVGRADGGGPAGGYGTYDGPIRRLAARRGVRLKPLGGSAQGVYRHLSEGRPVLVWIGLTAGPYQTWLTPEGANVRGNFGEHTVVLTGLRDGRLEVNDPLDGRRKTWSTERFEQLWPRLGRRALGV